MNEALWWQVYTAMTTGAIGELVNIHNTPAYECVKTEVSAILNLVVYWSSVLYGFSDVHISNGIYFLYWSSVTSLWTCYNIFFLNVH